MFFTTTFLLQILASFASAAAFAVVFKTQPRHLPFVGIGGILTYAVYYTVSFFTGELFLAALFSTLLTAVYSEFCARVRRAPAAVFLFTGLIPTVPGGDLYRAMHAVLIGNMPLALSYLTVAMKIGLGIASGIMIVSIVVGQISDYKFKKQRKKMTS